MYLFEMRLFPNAVNELAPRNNKTTNCKVIADSETTARTYASKKFNNFAWLDSEKSNCVLWGEITLPYIVDSSP